MVSQIHAGPLPFSLLSIEFTNRARVTEGFRLWLPPQGPRSTLTTLATWRASSKLTTLDDQQHNADDGSDDDEDETTAGENKNAVQNVCEVDCSWLQENSLELDDFAGWSALALCSSAITPKTSGIWIFLQLGAGLLLMAGFLLASSKLYPSPSLISTIKVEQCITSVSKLLQNRKAASREIAPESQCEDLAITPIHNTVTVESTVDEKAIQKTKPMLIRPACEDPAQDQAISSLHTLKVVETPFQSSNLCTRREYARWLVLASNILGRRPSERVTPVFRVDGWTSLAFDDVGVDDPDFPYIQGLAEAGVIPSKFNSRDQSNGNDKAEESYMFLPDCYITREDVVSWKAALEYPFSWQSMKVVELKTRYVDMPRSALVKPELLADVLAGGGSITVSAFGLSQRFQPKHVVTKGQAVLAIVSGKMSEALSEEVSRVESENLATERRLNELMTEAHARKEQDEELKKILALTKNATNEAQKLAEAQMHNIGIEKDAILSETFLYHVERAVLETEKKIILGLEESFTGKGQEMLTDLNNTREAKLATEKQKVQEEKEKHALQKLKSRIETEMRAIALARTWTEDKARTAARYARLLLECQKHWGIPGRSDCQQCEQQ